MLPSFPWLTQSLPQLTTRLLGLSTSAEGPVVLMTLCHCGRDVVFDVHGRSTRATQVALILANTCPRPRDNYSMVSPSFAPFAHPHVSCTSHSHSEDVDNSTGVYSEASDHSEACRHSEAGDANLDVRMMAIETDVKDVKTEVKDIKDFNKEIFHKIDILGIT